MAQELSAREFERRYREIVGALGQDNEGCVECVGCRASTRSTFCRDCEGVVRCHYCVRCSLCIDCAHCRSSRNLVKCNHCVEAEGCVQSSYLVLCKAMTDCTYCFGCAGLAAKDFHILNEPYERNSYFETLDRVSRALRL